MSRIADIVCALQSLTSEHGGANQFHHREVGVPASSQRRIGRSTTLMLNVGGRRHTATYSEGWWHVSAAADE